MTIRLTSPDQQRWTVRRAVVRGRQLRGHRWRWRGPSWLGDLAGLLELGNLADVPVIGVVVMAIVLPILTVVIAVGAPFIALALAEALVVGVLALIGTLAATLIGRPILIRATADVADVAVGSSDTTYVWAVKGWGASRRHRDRVIDVLGRGGDPATIGDGLVLSPADRPRPTAPNAPNAPGVA
ncbi:MAG: hypothetical protein ACK5OX_14140 [Desertimonas sp.]